MRIKFPRFHLSTLLLLCIFAGAAMGIYFQRATWRLDFSLPLDDRAVPSLYYQACVLCDRNDDTLLVMKWDKLYAFDLKSRTLRWERALPKSHWIRRSDAFVNIGDAPPAWDLYYSLRDGAVPDTTLGESWGTAVRIDTGRELTASHDGSEWLASQSAAIEVAQSNPPRATYPLKTASYCYSVAFLPNGRHVVLQLFDRIEFWRRIPAYGWRGAFESPLYWVAALSILGLGIALVRQVVSIVRSRRRSHATASPS
jgi:hypothetical protein